MINFLASDDTYLKHAPNQIKKVLNKSENRPKYVVGIQLTLF